MLFNRGCCGLGTPGEPLHTPVIILGAACFTKLSTNEQDLDTLMNMGFPVLGIVVWLSDSALGLTVFKALHLD
ncbi:MAG: hypothetical protein DCF22_04075 [Leptolyngbya sp.]|nr:MAG: hypothetical protein DCF22_04075 [Leptolyngbya sp.]